MVKFRCLPKIIVLFICLHYGSQAEEKCVYIGDETEYTFITETYETKELRLCMDYGYYLYVSVESVQTAVGDYVIVKPGKTIEDKGDGLIFTQTLKMPRNFVIDSSDIFIALEVKGSEECKKCTGATIKYKRMGEEISTTMSSPIETSTWPQPGANDSIYFTGYIYGQELSHYNMSANRQTIKEAVAKMAIRYTEENNFPVIHEIGVDNVLLYNIKACPLNWPNSDKCVAIRIALPIIMNETVNSGYELRQQHLDLMWVRYAQTYLQEFGLDYYSEPDVEGATTPWSLIFGILLLLFLVMIGLVVAIKDGAINCFGKKSFRRRKGSDASHIIGHEHRESLSSLSAHRLQVFPKIFEQDTWPAPVNHYNDDGDIFEGIDNSMLYQSQRTLKLSESQGNETET